MNDSKNSVESDISEWFLSREGNYDGPFTIDQVVTRLHQGVIPKDQIAWREGMTDWIPLIEIDSFREEAEAVPAALFSLRGKYDFIDGIQTAEVHTPPQRVSAPPRKSMPRAPTASNPAPKVTDDSPFTAAPPLMPEYELPADVAAFIDEMVPNIVPSAHTEAVKITNSQAWKKFFSIPEPKLTGRQKIEDVYYLSKRYVFRYKMRFALGTVAFIGLTAMTYSMSSKNTMPSLPDVGVEEARELRTVVEDRFGYGAAAVAIAKSTTDPYAPFFYVGANLPDNTKIDLTIEAIPETLVDRLRVAVRVRATVKSGIARTPAFRQGNGSPFPRGEYRITASCPTCSGMVISAGVKAPPLAQKTYFLGGARNSEYDQKLKLYHEKLREQSAEEIVELRQVHETLTGQLRETSKEFTRASASLDKGAWDAFESRWKNLHAQMKDLFARWTPEALDQSYLQSKLYSQTKLVGERLERLHGLQADYMATGVRDRGHEANIASEVQMTTNELASLLRNIETTEKLPATASGMPQTL